MLLACLFSCTPAEEEGTEEVTDTSAKTITMWVVTNDETTPEAQAKVNEAFTKITKSKFKTNVVLKFCTEDEYYDKLEGAIEANQADILLKEEHDKALRLYLRAHKDEKSKEELTKDFYLENPKYAKFQAVAEEEDAEETIPEDETMLNDYGIVEIKYPDEKENQVDIFYLTGQDKYMEYYNKEWLASLDEELNTSSKKIRDYVSKALLDGVQIGGATYAIPNNVAIGQYTYMMLDKQLFDEYYQKIGNVKTVLDVGTFLSDAVKYNETNGYTPDDPEYMVPLASTFEECMRMLTWYWELYYTDMSVYQTYADENGKTYAVKKFYEVEVEVEDPKTGEVSKETKTYSIDKVIEDMIYKTNEEGKLIDKDGNVLHYTYATDEFKAWYEITDKKENVSLNDKDADGNAYTGGMYLVDEEGNPVTPENDKRVVLADESWEPSVDDAGKYILEDDSIFTLAADGTLLFQGCAVEFSDDVETTVDSFGNQQPTFLYGQEKESNFSILGALQLSASLRNRGSTTLGFNSLFTMSDYRDTLTTLMGYEYNNYYGEVKEGQNAAVSFVKSDARIKLEYEETGKYVDPATGREYYALVAAYPEATEQELYGNMFAVYANSANISRSMRIITYLNTNEEFRNLLQYGIQGQHYEIEKVTETDELGIETVSQTVKLLPGNEEYGVYSMDVEKTGNCFIVTPTAEMGGANAWDYAKVQNNDSLINPLLGFDFNTMLEDSEYGLDVELITHINELSDETWVKIMECETAEDLKELIENTTNGLMKIFSASSGDAKLTKAVNGAYDPNAPLGADYEGEQTPDPSGHSPYAIYMSWLNQYGYAPGAKK